MNLDQFKAELESAGARIYKSAPILTTADWYACLKTQLPARACECNKDKVMQLIIYPYVLKVPNVPERQTAEIELTGEYKGLWYKLRVYSLTFDEAINRLNEIEAALIGAWNALETKSS